jgi:hypothetical protein
MALGDVEHTLEVEHQIEDRYNLSFIAPMRGMLRPTLLDLERYLPGRIIWKQALIEQYASSIINPPKWIELSQKGWEPIDYLKDGDLFMRLTSQLSLVLVFTRKGLPEAWARTCDIQHAQRYPITLVYESTPDASSSGATQQIVIGTHAITFEQGALYRYELSQLGELGHRYWQQMVAGVRPEPRLPTGTVMENVRHYNTLFSQAQDAALALSQLYWQLHERRSGAPIVRIPLSVTDLPPTSRQVPLYKGQGNLIPVTDGLEAAIRAMTDAHDGAKGWGRDRSKIPTFVHERANSTTAVTLRMNQQLIPENEQAIAQQLWERVTTYSDNDGDVLLAMLAQIVAAGPDERGGVWITVQAILEHRGILPKRHEVEPGVYRDAGHRPEDMRQIADCVGRLRDMHISVRSWREARKPGGRRRKVVLESYLVLISDFLTQAEEGQSREEALQIAWYYQPGSSLDVPIGKNAKVAWLLQQALRYDPYHEKWEKRLARYFMFQLRLNSSFGGTTIKRSIREILEEAGLFSSINQTDPIRTKERFEKAMRTLTEHGHISDWGETLYLEAMKKRPARGWLEMWLAEVLVITAAPLVEELARDMLDQIQTQQQRITTPKKQRRKKGDQQEG